MEFLDELTEGLDRVLMVRGGGREVITIYSWHETLRLAGDIFSAIAMQEKKTGENHFMKLVVKNLEIRTASHNSRKPTFACIFITEFSLILIIIVGITVFKF